MPYDSAIISYTDKDNKVDLNDAEHINALQDELVIIETILGVGIKGTAASVAARLSKALDSDGSIASGSSFPSAPAASQIFYRTDLDVLYIRNAANNAWLQQGGSVGNRLFEYTGQVEAQGASLGEYTGTSLTPNGSTGNYRYLQVLTGAPGTTIWTTKWTKISGVSTVNFRVRIWQRTTETVTLTADVGGQTGSVSGTASQTTPEWKTFTVDVSSLTNGTVYDVTIKMYTNIGVAHGYCSHIIGEGS